MMDIYQETRVILKQFRDYSINLQECFTKLKQLGWSKTEINYLIRK